ncbi:hypothetical protein RQP54_15575 [Curvibacter sp. APW13]|uniref:hypothetical protein n=1 Tax=Curvibacter sp. APW13 TaxID=3077236 RepID=UPI0028DE036A|nr:hypothetical protein [Curvibacter sp. APW13]MDT8992292.1 hypothetical protein [Curvibacter sp. APW13]
MNRTVKALVGALAALAVLAIGVVLWMQTLARDAGPQGRPTYGPYAWSGPGNKGQAPTPRGGPVPREDGYVMGSQGFDAILPPMPPQRVTDVVRAENAARWVAIKTCFWPGPKLRTGFYTTDPDDYGLENQIPDIGNTFSTAWFRIPAGARIVMTGQFPHLRHWSFVTYTENGTPRDDITDLNMLPDSGSVNPFLPGVRRDAPNRRYTVTIENGAPPAQRPANTVYTLAEPGTPIGMHMRNYIPDQGTDWTGGVGLPEVELHLADGTVLRGEEACAATDAPRRGKQVPIVVSKKLWLALNSLPWRPADRTPAKDFDVTTMVRFYNREHLILDTFFPAIPNNWLAVEKGGFWSNPVTRYGYTYLSQAYGQVYVARAKMPSTPSTFANQGEPLNTQADMRYWSLCTSTSPAIGNVVDCVHDENVRPHLDRAGFFNVVVSRAPDRPANATEQCGVVWMEYGNGDGIPGGSQDFGVLINRHTLVNPGFAQTWFNVKEVGSEAKVMGPYLPTVINLRTRQKFEALGCPVDTSKLATMAGH